MRHEIMLPIEVNTDAVEQKIERDAYTDVTDWLKKMMLEKGIPQKQKLRWDDPSQPDWRELVCHAANAFMDEHKDELLEAAASKIAERMAKIKAFKEAVAEVVE